jgi:hypothetical protein
MAYISQSEKKAIAPKIKALLKQYGLSGSLSVDNHSTLVLTVKSGKIDFIKNFNETHKNDPRFNPAKDSINVNPYWVKEQFTGKAKDFAVAAVEALRGEGWFDKSDIMSDYHHVKHYVEVKIGRWDRAYELV